MNIQETIDVITAVKDLWPDRARSLSDAAPRRWQAVLADVSARDAEEALVAMARRSEWFDLARLVAAVAEIRTARLRDVGVDERVILDRIRGLDGDWRLEVAELRHVRGLVLDGRMDRRGWEAYVAAGERIAPGPVAAVGA